jgi:hypothetical protein
MSFPLVPPRTFPHWIAHGEFARACKAVPVVANEVMRNNDDETREGRILVAKHAYLLLGNECVVVRCFAVSDCPMAGVQS